MRFQRVQRFLAIAAILGTCTIAGCEIDTKVTLDGKIPPTFKLSGTGSVNFIRVIEAPSGTESIADVPAMWEIKPSEDLSAIEASRLPPVTYGRIPPGFIQVTPQGAEAPHMEDGKSYHLWAPTSGANGGGIRFVLRDGKSIEVPARGPRESG